MSHTTIYDDCCLKKKKNYFKQNFYIFFIIGYLPVTQLYEFSNFLRIKASSKLNVWNSSSTSRSKCGFTSTWPTTPNSLTKPNGVQTVKKIENKK